jgi:hypothetical protein
LDRRFLENFENPETDGYVIQNYFKTEPAVLLYGQLSPKVAAKGSAKDLTIQRKEDKSL